MAPMLALAKDLRTRVITARSAILQLFLKQVTEGAQSTGLDEDAAACGQFVGQSALALEQRGGHGTAAALCVLGSSDAVEAQKLANRLVNYMRERRKRLLGHKEEREVKNVIKMSETLFALTQVLPASGCNTEVLARELVDDLAASRKKNAGWSYFTDDAQEAPEVLPTAYALLALAEAGHPVDKEVQLLAERLSERYLKENPSNVQTSDVTTDIACLYALGFRRHDAAANGIDKTVRSVLGRILERHRSLLVEDIEQNIEYWYGSKTYYVRVPYQLYLLALTARYSFRRFCSVAAQGRLRAILAAVEGSGFRYPNSGEMLSSRTNAILFEVLGRLQAELHEGRHSSLWVAADEVRTFIGSPKVAKVLSFSVLAMMAYCVYLWATWTARPPIATLAPSFVNAFLFWILRLGKKK